MSENKLPDNLFYNQDYSWVEIDGDIATLGIIKPAADKIKEFIFIKLPNKGQVLKKGEIYVSLEALKWSGHLSSPLSGKIIEVNEKLFDEPSIINRDPYGQGWIIKIKMTDSGEGENLLNTEQAEEWANQGMKKD